MNVSHFRNLCLVILLTVALTLILGFQLLPSRYELAEGDVAPQTFKAPAEAIFISKVQTEQQKKQAAAKVGQVFIHSTEVESQQLSKLRKMDTEMWSVLADPQLSASEKKNSIREIEGVELSPRAIDLCLEFSEDQWRIVIAEAERLLENLFAGRIEHERVEAIKQRLPEDVNPDISVKQALVTVELARPLIKPNMIVDAAETEKARQAAMDQVADVQVPIKKGQTIVREGDPIDVFTLEKLDAVGLLKPKFRWRELGGVALLSFILSSLLGFYIYLYQPSSLASDRRLLLLALVIVGAVLAAKLTIPERELYMYLFPVAATPMLIATLLDAQLAILVTAILSLLVAYVGGNTVEMVVVYLAGGLVGLLTIRRAERLNRFFIAGGGVALSSFAVIVAFRLLEREAELSRLGLYAGVSLGNGLLSASLTLGIFVLLGFVFGITTSIHLLELAQPNQPLLRRLLIEAPGTYHHSIIVGNMAERAADAIGADSLLVRVGSYYHDIGKIPRPGFFVENQRPGENVHDRLDPETSARIVISHVKDGLDLAQNYRLPAKVQDFIAEHHGTRLATYFYHEAKQKGGEIDRLHYAYPGPRPQTKETAIVMLADSIEAVVRGAQDATPEQVDEILNKVVAERLAEGQLDECDLTLSDIDLIKQAFKDVLRGVFHPRIEYPEDEEEGSAQEETHSR